MFLFMINTLNFFFEFLFPFLKLCLFLNIFNHIDKSILHHLWFY